MHQFLLFLHLARNQQQALAIPEDIGNDFSSLTVLVSEAPMYRLPFGFWFRSGLWSRSPSNLGWVEPYPKNFRLWSRSLKFGFRFHSPSLWGRRVVQIIQWFQFSVEQIILELEPKTSVARNWTKRRSLKFEFRLHSPVSCWIAGVSKFHSNSSEECVASLRNAAHRSTLSASRLRTSFLGIQLEHTCE